MGLAIDSIAGGYTMAASAARHALTMAAGDSLTIRNFNSPAQCLLEEVILDASSGPVNIELVSPLLIDNVRGIQLSTGLLPSRHLLTQMAAESMHAQDTLAANILGPNSATTAAILRMYYTDLPGVAARLMMPGDIMSRIVHTKGIEVDCTGSGTAATWVDTLINATEDLLPANTDFAVLGYTTSAAIMGVGVKGQDTGNLRIAGPGMVDTNVSFEYFIRESERTGRPHIPVFNSANKNNFYVSIIDQAASTNVNVFLICAELR